MIPRLRSGSTALSAVERIELRLRIGRGLLERRLRAAAVTLRGQDTRERVEDEVRVQAAQRRRLARERLGLVEPLLLIEQPGEVVHGVARLRIAVDRFAEVVLRLAAAAELHVGVAEVRPEERGVGVAGE